MRLLALLTAAVLLTAGTPAWAWLRSMPGEGYWPPLPEPGGIAAFAGTWLPQGCGDVWTEHGNMTLHPGGRITYADKKKPFLPGYYRVIETTPNYVVLMSRRMSKEFGEILRFGILQSVSPESPRNTLAWNECRPATNDLKGFSWGDDDAALARVWAGAKTCNPVFATGKTDRDPFFGDLIWNQECQFVRFND